MGGTEVTINWNMVFVWGLLISNLVMIVRSHLRDQDKKNAKAIAEVSTQLQNFIRDTNQAKAEQNERLAGIEAVMEHMPTTEEVTLLRETVASTKARVEGMGELLTRVDHQTRLIHEHLLRHH